MTIALNPAVRDKWIAALTSGQYEQGRHALSPGNVSYCCLGVLCEVASGEGVIDTYHSYEPLPPERVLDWAGLSMGDAETCAGWNDSDGLSFAEIAARLA